MPRLSAEQQEIVTRLDAGHGFNLRYADRKAELTGEPIHVVRNSEWSWNPGGESLNYSRAVRRADEPDTPRAYRYELWRIDRAGVVKRL